MEVVEVVEFRSLPPLLAYQIARSVAVIRNVRRFQRMHGSTPDLTAERIEDFGMPSNAAAWLGA